jgi:lipopolysaccharide export system permease protein
MIKSSRLLTLYFARQFAFYTVMAIFLFCALIYIVEFLDVIRRSARVPDLSFVILAKMAFFKMPEAGQKIIPFAILFAAMFSFWRLTKSSELIVARAHGLSIWQLMAPFLMVAFMAGVIATAFINPAASIMLSKFDRLEQRYFAKENALVTLSRTGIWLRQFNLESAQDEKKKSERPYIIFHAKRFDPQKWLFHDVSGYYLDADGRLLNQIEAKQSYLNNGQWQLQDVTGFDETGRPVAFKAKNIPTSLTKNEIENSFASPETLSFWQMPDYISLMKDMGFSAARLQSYFQQLLAQPFLFMAMVLLAACVSLRMQRQGGAMQMMMLGVSIGFIIFFMDSVMVAFGISQKIPIVLAAWTPTFVTFLLGVTVLLHLEDG